MPRANRAVINDAQPTERDYRDEDDDKPLPSIVGLQLDGMTAVRARAWSRLYVFLPVISRAAAVDH